MKIEIARYAKDPEQILFYLARMNVVPVKAPPWADHPFELRRNEKTKMGLLGHHMVGKETTPIIIELLGIHDEKSCDAVRKRINKIRKSMKYK